VLGAAERLRNEPRILFLLVGGGHRFDELARRVAERGLDRSFRFVPYQKDELLKLSLSVPDVHWISLPPALEGLIFPSKLYGVAAVGRPVIAIAAPDGEPAELVRASDCGYVIAPGDSRALADLLVRLAGGEADLAAMGRRARAMLEAQFSRRMALDRWRRLIETIG
jgi:glycosyltransferase involved in cell wall biosynthesis